MSSCLNLGQGRQHDGGIDDRHAVGIELQGEDFLEAIDQVRRELADDVAVVLAVDGGDPAVMSRTPS